MWDKKCEVFCTWHCIAGHGVTFVSSSSSRERERERETPVTSLISRWNREWSCTWFPWRRADPARRRVLSLSSARSACKDNKLGAWALDRAARSSDWWMTMGKWKLQAAFVDQTAVDHPAAFRWHTSSKKIGPSWCLYPFWMATVLPSRTAWIADILLQASLRDVERQRCWKRGRGSRAETLGLLYGTTERSFNAVDKQGSTLTWTVCKAIGGSW